MNKGLFSKELIKDIELKYQNKNKEKMNVGDLIKVSYKTIENGKERIQIYKGIIIKLQNKGLGKTFTIRRKIEGIGTEQTFLYYSPKIFSILKEFSHKVSRSKLYYLRYLIKKSKSLKI